jgi:hypothetical protein
MIKKIKNIILDCAIWIVNTIGNPFMKALDTLVEREDEVKKIKAKKAAPKQAPPYFTTTTNTSQQILSISAATSNVGIGTTTVNPYTFSSSSFQQSPFSIGFSWAGKTKTITLEDGNDVLKLADVTAMLLKINNIPFKITES